MANTEGETYAACTSVVGMREYENAKRAGKASYLRELRRMCHVEIQGAGLLIHQTALLEPSVTTDDLEAAEHLHLAKTQHEQHSPPQHHEGPRYAFPVGSCRGARWSSPSHTFAHQPLIKTVHAAVNPVDIFVSEFGLLVESWPPVPGCEASRIFVRVGAKARNPLGRYFKEGNVVAGCARVLAVGNVTFAEYFLLNAGGAFEAWGFDDDGNGAGAWSWAIVFGGAGVVGKYAVQALKLAGCRVATTCSTTSFELLKSLGAHATIDYRTSPEEVVEEVKRVTQEKLELAYDAVSVNNDLISKIFTAVPTSSSSQRLYTTMNDWDPAPDASLGFITKSIALGPIGRPSTAELNSKVNS
ncbi:hypothetical protein DPSP01_002855 [Paraphaeosphaeria sporulosa]